MQIIASYTDLIVLIAWAKSRSANLTSQLFPVVYLSRFFTGVPGVTEGSGDI